MFRCRDSPGIDHARAAQRSVIQKTVITHETVVLNCGFNFPNVSSSSGGDGRTQTKHMISWRKDGIEVPIFLQIDDFDPHVDERYDGRIRLLQQASIQLSDVKREDEGEYECQVKFLDNEHLSPNATWIHLTVHCKYLFMNYKPLCHFKLVQSHRILQLLIGQNPQVVV